MRRKTTVGGELKFDSWLTAVWSSNFDKFDKSAKLRISVLQVLHLISILPSTYKFYYHKSDNWDFLLNKPLKTDQGVRKCSNRRLTCVHPWQQCAEASFCSRRTERWPRTLQSEQPCLPPSGSKNNNTNSKLNVNIIITRSASKFCVLNNIFYSRVQRMLIRAGHSVIGRGNYCGQIWLPRPKYWKSA